MKIFTTLLLFFISLSQALKHRIQYKKSFQTLKKKFYSFSFEELFKCRTNESQSLVNLKPQQIVFEQYELNQIILQDIDDSFERWKAFNKEDNQFIQLKFYLRQNYENQTFILWTQKSHFPIPSDECQQLSYLQQQINKNQYDKNITVEQCLENNFQVSQKPSSNIPCLNKFPNPQGKSLSQLCIQNDCLSYLNDIIKLIFQTVKIFNQGPFFIIRNIDTDTIFLQNLHQIQLYWTNIKYNRLLQRDQSQLSWKQDFELIGSLILKILTQNCEFQIADEKKQSSIYIYLEVVKSSQINVKNKYLGIPKDFFQQESQNTFQEKDNLLQNSIFGFVWRCFNGDEQFFNAVEALQHPFLNDQTQFNI